MLRDRAVVNPPPPPARPPARRCAAARPALPKPHAAAHPPTPRPALQVHSQQVVAPYGWPIGASPVVRAVLLRALVVAQVARLGS